MITLAKINTEADKTDTLASDAQREAGNYRKGHISVKGMRIAIESPKGSRRYYDNGRKYNVMKNHYGYFNITKGKDGDAVDVFLGPDIENFENVYCIDQNTPGGDFDETKVMLGFSSKEEAKDAYMSNYDENWKGFGNITAVSLDDFKKWLYRGRKQRQPFADYVYIQKKKLDEMKKVIKLNENDIARIVRESVKHVLMESKYMHSLDYSYPTPQNDDEEQDYKYEQWLKQQEPTQKDWDDFGFWASKDEPRLDYDEMDPYVSQQEAKYLNGPHDVYPVDADDEGSGFSRDYDAGVEYAKNLIAKSNVPENAVKELEEKESNGTISAFELGILDTLDEE